MHASAPGDFSQGDGPFIVACDLGGTTMDLALVDGRGRIVLRHQAPSPGQGKETDRSLGLQTLDQVGQLLEQFIDASGAPREHMAAVGIGLPGVTDPARGIVTAAPALGWWAVPVAGLLEHRLGMPIFIENDVNAAAVGEQCFGAGARLRDFVFVAIGTGIGAGLILGSRLYRGHRNSAGEVGYLAIDRDWLRARARTAAPGESFGCWESLASGPAVARLAQEELERVPDEARAVWEGKRITARTVLASAAHGDPVGLRSLERLAENLALGLTNIIALLDPQAILLGGGVAQAGPLLVQAVQRWLDRVAPWTPPLLLAQLGPDAGVLGAAAIALQGLQEGKTASAAGTSPGPSIR